MSNTMDATLSVYKIERRMQISLRNLLIACITENVLQYRLEN